MQPLLLPAAILAATIPTLLAYHQPPSATLLNQCLAVALWGAVAALLAPARIVGSTAPLLAALALVAAAAAASSGLGSLPLSLALQAIGLLAAAGVMVVAGAAAARRPSGPAAFSALAWALLVAGVAGSVVAVIQVFLPAWADGPWIAPSGLVGRAVGNLRQPNHLCSLLLWALVAAVALHELRRLPRSVLWAVAALLVFAIELTASRTGAVGLLLLLLWGAFDRRLSPATRGLLVLTPVLYAGAYGAMAWVGEPSHLAIGASARLADGGGLSDLTAGGSSPNSRLNIARNTWALIVAQPLLGVGFGEFNFAWSITAFPGRPTAFFDHTHSLPLQLAVELGLPLAGLVLLLLLTALVQAWRRTARASGDAATAARASLLLVLLIGLHSLVEYPLWYAYFLLPAALAWGFSLGAPAADGWVEPPGARSAHQPLRRHAWLGAGAGLVVSAGGVLAALDYQRAVVIYAPGDGAVSLAERVADGQRSRLFAHHADYAAATNPVPPDSAARGFVRAPHSLLDTRLMVAWARHLAVTGDVDRARWLAQRLREFRNPDADAFFEPCEGGAQVEFQCQAPESAHDWREFAKLPPRLAP
ncbi:MAG: O-antigen ligase C-terminal domain-containing protein [Microbacteriaceae bacterium]|nr:O-antigen ligase C-terminal domain-containing protein [Burkholderiaceae bacterium]